MTFENLVSVEWLNDRLKHQNLRVIDATLYLPTHGKNALVEFQQAAIPGAVFFDLDSVKNEASPLPHMLPSAEKFAREMDKLGVKNSSTVVVYDQLGLFSAARLWWMFKLFGHDDVFILNGGLPAWQAAGLVVAPAAPRAVQVADSAYICQQDNRSELVMDRETLIDNPDLWQHVLDARPEGRFNGYIPEPRPGARSGHIPGSTNVPFSDLLDKGFLKPVDQLQTVLAPVATDTPITSCGSGLTAAILTLALAEIGAPTGQLYDGSWADWGRNEAGTPVDTTD